MTLAPTGAISDGPIESLGLSLPGYRPSVTDIWAFGAAEPGRKSGNAGKVHRAKGFPVINFGGPAVARDFDALLRQVRGKVGTIVEYGEVAVDEFQFEAAAILSVAIARDRVDGGDGRAGKETEQVDEVTGFAHDASPALLRIERPMTGR